MYTGQRSALFHLQFLAIMTSLLTNEAEYVVSFAVLRRKKLNLLSGQRINDLCVYAFIMGPDGEYILWRVLVVIFFNHNYILFIYREILSHTSA